MHNEVSVKKTQEIKVSHTLQYYYININSLRDGPGESLNNRVFKWKRAKVGPIYVRNGVVRQKSCWTAVKFVFGRKSRVEGWLAQRRWDGNGKPSSLSKTKRQLVSVRCKYSKGGSRGIILVSSASSWHLLELVRTYLSSLLDEWLPFADTPLLLVYKVRPDVLGWYIFIYFSHLLILTRTFCGNSISLFAPRTKILTNADHAFVRREYVE